MKISHRKGSKRVRNTKEFKNYKRRRFKMCYKHFHSAKTTIFWLFKVVPYCFLKSKNKCKFQPQKVPMPNGNVVVFNF